MSTLIQNVMEKTSEPASIATSNNLEKDASGQVQASVSRETSLNDSAQNSAPLNTLLDRETKKDFEVAVQATLPKDVPLSEEVANLLVETDETGKLYKHPRHFAQLGQRQGLTVYLGHANADGPATIPITFEKGVFSTNDVKLVAALELALRRKDGLTGQFKQISAQHYQGILANSQAASRLRGVQGTVNSGDMKTGADQTAVTQVNEENAKLRQQLAEMQERLATVSKETEKQQDGNTALFGGKDKS